MLSADSREGTGKRASSRPYRIVLPLGRALDVTLETLDSVVRHAAAPEALLVIGDRTGLEELAERRPGLPGEVFEIGPGVGPTAAFPSLLEAFPGEDLLLVLPGMAAVPLFDLRLAWSAEAAPDSVALSPLCESDPICARLRSDLAEPDVCDLDRLVSGLRDPAAVDAPSLLEECFFLQREACEGLAADDLATTESLSAALRRRGRVLGLVPHVVVGTSSSSARRPAGAGGAVFLAESSVDDVAKRVLAHRDPFPMSSPVRRRARPRVLHVAHSLGGGLEHWVRLFASADDILESWVLRSVGSPGEFGRELWLYDDPSDPRPRRVWPLASPIAATAIHHLDYRRVLREIVDELGIDTILVSSLIGHSLDALRTGVPTAFVCHDYYPFCPALHIRFEGVCESCTPARLQRCRDQNTLVDLFRGRDAEEWLALREAFFDAMCEHRVPVVVPSASVERHYRRLAPELADLRFELVEHATGTEHLLPVRAARQGRRPASTERPLRAVILGRLAPIKGAELLPPIVRRLGRKVEISLVGCGLGWTGEAPGGELIPDYEPSELPGILERLDPDLAVLLSIVPETFSFTLGECIAAGVPPLATRMGGFEDRIVEGVTGFLVAPTAEAVVEGLLGLAADPTPLVEVERHLASMPQRTAEEMVRDYAALLGPPVFSARAYFSGVSGQLGRDRRSSSEVSKTWLPPRSPLGFRDFLAQVEAGTRHHLESTRRLAPWQRWLARGLARITFGFVRRLLRAL